MPLRPCKVKGKSGTKYGESGKCYPGAGGEKMALRQMAAIKASQARAGKGKKKK